MLRCFHNVNPVVSNGHLSRVGGALQGSTLGRSLSNLVFREFEKEVGLEKQRISNTTEQSLAKVSCIYY